MKRLHPSCWLPNRASKPLLLHHELCSFLLGSMSSRSDTFSQDADGRFLSEKLHTLSLCTRTSVPKARVAIFTHLFPKTYTGQDSMASMHKAVFREAVERLSRCGRFYYPKEVLLLEHCIEGISFVQNPDMEGILGGYPCWYSSLMDSLGTWFKLPMEAISFIMRFEMLDQVPHITVRRT